MSTAITRWAKAVSRLARASTASPISFSARPPISVTLRAISCRSTSKALAVCSDIMVLFLRGLDQLGHVWSMVFSENRHPLFGIMLNASAEANGDIVLGTAVSRRGEHFCGRVELD